MSIGLLFWVLVVFTLVFDLWFQFKSPQTPPTHFWLTNTLLFVLILLLGWQVFGPALHR